jgi:quinol-cytochrome oxidoreductase complex cytochrome b subunit/coenzyme F420-reducing hydrogenase delta subunit/Pyruvate/2-oxoacid:ferredoxin oxidoreductase delta subunit
VSGAALPPAGPLRRAARRGLDAIERAFDRPFGQRGNPWRHLGGLAFHLFWIVAVSGIWVYVGFDTEVEGAYASVERLSSNAFPLGSLARSLHRYASDAFVLVVLLHLAREWILGRYAHFRRFSWLTGVFALWLVYASGIGGFWLVWDRIAQYSLIATAEWLDVLPVFDGALIRNFIAEGAVNDRLFSLLIFLHIGIPLALLAAMWVHLQRLALPETAPPRAMAWATLGALVLLSIAVPVASDAAADLSMAPGTLALDWYYLGVHAFADATSPLWLWVVVAGFTLLLVLLPWTSRAARAPRPLAALVNLGNCNGCARCFADCPYAAVTMQPRTDGRHHPRQAVVDPDLCAGCGICAGACPSSTPFRSVTDLVTGIDMPQAPVHELRGQLEAALAQWAQPVPEAAARGFAEAALAHAAVPRIIAFGCSPQQGGPDLAAIADAHTATLPLLCAAQLPPSFVEYALRAGADGVLVTGCRGGECTYRLGNRWTEERMAGARAPRLRAAVPRERVRIAWSGPGAEAELRAALASFRAELTARAGEELAAFAPPPKRSEPRSVRVRAE